MEASPSPKARGVAQYELFKKSFVQGHHVFPWDKHGREGVCVWGGGVCPQGVSAVWWTPRMCHKTIGAVVRPVVSLS